MLEIGGIYSMSIEVFLCVPAAIFSVGFLIFSILFMNPDKLKQAPFDIQIGKIDKDLIVRLSKKNRRKIRNLILVATVVLSIITTFPAIVLVIFFRRTVLTFFACIILQIILFLMIGTPFYKKLKTITNYK